MDSQSALAELQATRDLSILTLSLPFVDTLNADGSFQPKRDSNASSPDGREGATPLVLAADLTHYQELFSKLRFSYVEQVTKERFLRAITAEQPDFVDPNENVELENKLKIDKASLKERKEEVRELVRELEEQARSLASRYENIQLKTVQLESLPSQISVLESTITRLQQSQASPTSDNPALSLPLQPTLELLGEKEQQLADLDRQIETLQAALPQKRAEVAARQDEVAIMNTKKINSVEEAQEARRSRDNGGLGDKLEERGRWLRAVDTGLRTMLEV